jgi:tetratricopeptide (TPR) repeat protein
LAKHHKHGSGGAFSTADLKARIERTRHEGKYQQALELVKQLNKAEPTPANLELLKDTYFQRAVQLRNQGYMRDAATVLEVAARLDEKNPTWIQKLAAEMARCGEVARSMALAGKVPNPEAQTGLMAQLADGAMLKGKDARNALPAALQTEYDRVIEAFNLAATGHDDKAREVMQAVGLRSPFLEWKLLLRGFQAFYVKEDERALENWQRLDPERIPFRLAAPFRAAIDPPYRAAQHNATQQLLQRQFDEVQASLLGRLAQDLRKASRHTQNPVALYRTIEQLLPVLKQEAPHLLPRLARFLYWGIPEAGPDAIHRHKRLFGAPPDDRNFHRIQAIAQERHGSLDDAHVHWRAYEEELASQPETWAGEQGKLARALIWQRMGDNAAKVPTEKMLKKMPRLFRFLSRMPDPLNPSAEQCFRRAIDLAPNLLEAHRDLFEHYKRQEETNKAIQTAEKLLDLFPDDVETLEELADLHAHKSKPTRAIELLERALKHNPLRRDLRMKLLNAQMVLARQLAESGKFDQARVQYQAALGSAESDNVCSICCRWAAAEMKAGDQSRADELLQQARTRSPGELLINYTLLVEANRLALGSAVKRSYTKEFNKETAGTGTPALAAAMVNYVRSLGDSEVSYHGQKSHTKKIYEYADRIDKSAFSEAQLKQMIGDMIRADAPPRLLGRFLAHARSHYPANPYFPYFDAINRMGDEPEEGGRVSWQVGPLLDEAEAKARGLPADPELKALLDDISRRRQLLALLNPFLHMPFPFPGGIDPEDFFGSFGFDDDDDDFEDDEDGW